jgi:hypothetical protein
MNQPDTPKTLGIITIATGKYFEEFIPTLKSSIDQYFNFPGYQIHFYCFTDSKQVTADITNIPIKHFSWPFSTLLRYRWIEQNLPMFDSHDFVLYMDADMRVVSTPPVATFASGLIAVRHPGYLHSHGAFEIDRQDSCYVPPQLRKNYYQGCFWGGHNAQFSQLIRALSKMVGDDLGLGLIPIWHDESYLNKYLSNHACEALPPTYAWPEALQYSQVPYILHLEKKHQVIRQDSIGRLNIDNFLKGKDIDLELAIYKKLYLKAHEKCQRLESRLVQKKLPLRRFREWLSYYKTSNK